MPIHQITGLLNFIWVIIIAIEIGMKVSVKDLLGALRQTKLIMLALLQDYLLVPLFTLGLIYFFQPSPFVAAGILTLMLLPGAPFGPVFASLAKGDMPFSIGLTVLLIVSSMLISPWILNYLLAIVTQSSDIKINYALMFQVMLYSQVLPLLVGIGTRQYLQGWVGGLEKILKPLSLGLSLIVCTLILSNQYKMFAAFTPRAIMGLSLLYIFCFGLSWWSASKNRAIAKSFALSNVMRNAAVALIITATNFAGTPATLAVLAYSVALILGSLAAAILMRRA